MAATQRSTDPSERRREHRHHVSWDGECRLGGWTLAGRVRDASMTGVFFQPGAPPDAKFNSKGNLQSILQVGDQFVLSVLTRPEARPKRAVATLCWSGFSWIHKCHGYGIRIEMEP